MNTIESLTGITFDKIAILLGCLLTFPIGHLYLKLNLSDNYKHFYNIFFGMGLGYILMGASGVLHTLISSVVTYMICFHFPSKLAVKLVWIWSLSYMLLAHIIRTINVSNGHFLDYCVIQMMVTTRLTAFASNLYYKNVDQNEYWKKYQFQTLPNILEFLGYIYFYPTYLVGPFIEFVDYNNYIKSRPKPIYKSALYTRITQCIMLLVGLFYLKTYYPVENILKDGFWNLSFGKRFVYLYLASLGYRLSYQFIWTCIHTNMIFIGFAKDLCDFINMDLTFELSTLVKQVPVKWNILTGEWLRHHCYERLTLDVKVSSGKAMFVTNMLSAFWHGIFPGYYIAFALGSFTIEIGRLWHRKIVPRLNPILSIFNIHWLYHVLCWFTTMVCCVGMSFYPFIVLNLYDIFRIYSTLYFIPQVLMVVSFIILVVIAGKK